MIAVEIEACGLLKRYDEVQKPKCDGRNEVQCIEYRDLGICDGWISCSPCGLGLANILSGPRPSPSRGGQNLLDYA